MSIFLKGKTAGVENFYRNFVLYDQKTTFQGTSSIVMDVFLLLNVVWFHNVMQVEVFNSTFLVHQSAFMLKFDVNYPSLQTYHRIDILQ